MLPGPTIIKKCYACSQLIEEPTLMSGNTFGSTIWTDSKMEAPMLPEQPWLVECPHCSAYLWLDELETVGEVSWDDAPSTHKDTKQYKIPRFASFLKALNSELSHAKERYVRLNAWWAGNDARRKKPAGAGMSSDEEKNVQALMNLLDLKEPSDRLMKAEILRELGRFGEAIELLDGDFGELSVIKNNMLTLARANNRTVSVINYDHHDE